MSAKPAEEQVPPSAEEPDELLGKTIGGRFKILDRVARGGMGKVYRAEQAPLGRICALKVLSPSYKGDGNPEFTKRFLLEASTASKLSHPNTVTIFDYGQDGELYYIAMEFIEGRTLFRVLREAGGPIGEARTLRVAQQICRSLREAHQLGLVHRDLKPGNILVTDHGDEKDVVKVLDFGLVKDLSGNHEDLTQQGMFMGSPKYMAPEQVTGDEITARTDIYSLGVLIFEMLTGKVPFGGTGMATLMAHVNNAPPKMKDVAPPGTRISDGIDDVVTRCLKKSPDDRYQSMKDLLHALKLAGGEEGTFIETSESNPATRIPFPPDSLMPSLTPPSHSGIRTDLSKSTADSLVGSSQPDQLRPKRRFPAVAMILALAVGVGGAAFFLSQRNKPADAAGTEAAKTGDAVAQKPNDTAGPAGASKPANTQGGAVAPAGPAIQMVKVVSDPKGASVFDGDVQKCSSTPCEFMIKADPNGKKKTLTLKKAGYKNGTVEVGPTDESVTGTLAVVPYTGPKEPAPAASGYKKSPYD